MSLSSATSLSVPGRQPWPPPRSSALWTYNQHLSHYFLIVTDLPHDIYISADIMVRLNACIDNVNYIIWSPLSHQLKTSVNLKNLQSSQTMTDPCTMITEQGTIPAYSKSVSVHFNMRPGQTLNSELGFFQTSRTCLKFGLTLEATPLIEVSPRVVYVLFNNCTAQYIHVPKASHLGKGSSTRNSLTLN